VLNLAPCYEDTLVSGRIPPCFLKSALDEGEIQQRKSWVLTVVSLLFLLYDVTVRDYMLLGTWLPMSESQFQISIYYPIC